MPFTDLGTYTPDGWRAWYGTNVAVDAEGVTLATEPAPAYVSPTLVIAAREGFEPVDVALDDCGDLYVLSRDGDVYRYDSTAESVDRLPCIRRDGIEPRTPRALCVTPDTVYVADGASADGTVHGRIHAFSKHVLQTRWIVEHPFVDPTGVATDGHHLFVVDAGADRGFLASVDPGGATTIRIEELHAPVDVEVDQDGAPRVLEAESDESVISTVNTDVWTMSEVVRVPHETVLPACLEHDREGNMLVGAAPATGGEKTLFRTRDDSSSLEKLPSYRGSSRSLERRTDDLTTEGAGLYVVDGENGDVYFLNAATRHVLNSETGDYDGHVGVVLDAEERGMQWHRVTVTADGDAGVQMRLQYFATNDPVPDVETIDGIGPQYGGRLRDANVRTLTDLAGLNAERIAAITHASPGTVDGWLAAATEYIATQWGHHGAAIDASGSTSDVEVVDGISSESSARLRAAGVETVGALVAREITEIATVAGVSPALASQWRAEARRILVAEREHNAMPLSVDAPADVLLNEADGRYLWVRLNLVGRENASPIVRTFRAYFPRTSYLRHLPAAYQSDERSAVFLERFLSVFESIFLGVEEDIETITRYFDPGGIQSAYLSWLGDWLAVEADETWPDAARRTFITRAPELFKQRGTKAGLLTMLDLFLELDDQRPEQWEQALNREQRRLETLVADGVLTANEAAAEREQLAASMWLFEYGDLDCIDDADLATIYRAIVSCPQCFIVFVPPFVDPKHLPTIQRIVASQTPAHAVGRAVRLRPRIQLAGPAFPGHSYLGVNTVLSDREFVVDLADLGADSTLREREPFGQLDIHSRLDDTTELS